MTLKHLVAAAVCGGALFAASADIGLYHPDFDRRSYNLPCSDIDGGHPVIVDFNVAISTRGDIFSIVVKDPGDREAVIDVEKADKKEVRGTYSFEPVVGTHTLVVVITKTSGSVFGDTADVRIYDDTNGTCSLPRAGG